MGIPALLVLVNIFVMTSAAPADDLIVQLPGLKSTPNFKQYSGYLSGTDSDKLHYWFVESEQNPSTDPVVLWLNGGPGCSSMFGILTENGPFRIQNGGKTLVMNEYRWNKIANMLYLESPAKVGFSYSPGDNYTTSDDEVSLTNYHALKSFFMKFPEFKKNDFYMTGESYAGYYVPTLSVRVMQDSDINFKGVAIGNGFSGMEVGGDSLIYFAYYHGLIGDVTWNGLLASCCSDNILSRCAFGRSLDKTCTQLVNKVLTIVYDSGLNQYNLYAPCAGPHAGLQYNATLKTASLFMYSPWISNPVMQQNIHKLKSMIEVGYDVEISLPCVSTKDPVTYLNTPKVRKALHIPLSVPSWKTCSSKIGLNYISEYSSMTMQYQTILSKGKRMMVYNGDVDMTCNFLGDEWFVNDLKRKVIADRRIWYYKEIDGSTQVGGFVKQMEGISLVTIRGSGHMVPTDKPLPAYIMFSHFINNQPL